MRSAKQQLCAETVNIREASVQKDLVKYSFTISLLNLAETSKSASRRLAVKFIFLLLFLGICKVRNGMDFSLQEVHFSKPEIRWFAVLFSRHPTPVPHCTNKSIHIQYIC